MMNKTMRALLVLLSGVSLLVVACGQISGAPTSPTGSGGRA
jgi:hypothetical protein